jgi:proteasome lid subunit RPN8/RPN11
MRVRRSVLDAIAEHARQETPNECCGILIGTVDEIVEAVAAANVAVDPSRRYEVSPADHFAQVKRCRERNRASGAGPDGVASGFSRKLQVVGVYHSHPHNAPEPSPTDCEQAFSECLFVIAGPVDGVLEMDIRAYRLNEGTLEAVGLEPIPDPEN